MRSAFAAYADEGDLPDFWRPVVERLADRAHDWPDCLPLPDEFCVSEAVDCLEAADGGLLVWTVLGVCRSQRPRGAAEGTPVRAALDGALPHP